MTQLTAEVATLKTKLDESQENNGLLQEKINTLQAENELLLQQMAEMKIDLRIVLTKLNIVNKSSKQHEGKPVNIQ
jgi:septal ring factor EnvC (AmiA/AmiB activator)